MAPLILATFASLRLGENRRLNKEAHCSQRRKGAGRKGACSLFQFSDSR